MSLQPTSKSNTCPICENDSGKCRQGKEDTLYVQCMTYADAKKGEIVGGYKCIGQTKNKAWGQFRLDNSAEWTLEKRREWQLENQRRIADNARKDEEKQQRSLSTSERQTQYEKLFTELRASTPELAPNHLKDLQRRGLTQNQINLLGAVSVRQYQQIRGEYSDLLPGVNTRDKQIVTLGDGYLYPVRDASGLIVGCQIRIMAFTATTEESKPEEKGTRYAWMSGGRSKGTLQHFYGHKGELPLAVHFPEEIKRFAIGLCEGTGVKPLLAAQRLGIPFIGAAGGNHASSPETLKAAIRTIKAKIWEALQPKLGEKPKPLPEAATEIPIEIYPDAGFAQNSGVSAQMNNTIALLGQWGWLVKVAWWGQTTKADGDIDELQDYNSIQYISVEEFTAIAIKKVEKVAFDPADLLPPDTEPDPIEYAAYTIQEQFEEEIAPIQKADALQQWMDSRPERMYSAWRKGKCFTPDITSDSQWFDAELPPENSMFFGKAGLGRGKTTQLGKWVQEWKVQKTGFTCLGYRNTLLLQLCEKLGFYHIHEGDAATMRFDSTAGIALCVDSLWRFKPDDFDGKILILDEVMSVIRHLLHSPTVKGRDNILELFHQAIQRANQVICLDGNLADWAVVYLHAIAPDKKIIRFENTYKGDKPPINFLVGAIGSDGELKTNDRSPALSHLLEKSTIPAIATDSQVLAEALDNLLTEKGLKVLRIDSKTVPEEYVKEFLKNCDKYIRENTPDVIIYTPSAESGVDISITDYFTEHFGFFFGVLGVDAILQMLGRIRDSKCPKYVWVREWVAQSEQSHSKSPFLREVGKAVEKLLAFDVADAFSGCDRQQEISAKLAEIYQRSLDPNFNASNQIQAIDNYEKASLRTCVRESLQLAGYEVTDVTDVTDKEAKDNTKEATDDVKVGNCKDIFYTEKISLDDADKLKFDARWEERVKVIQAHLRAKLPGIEEKEMSLLEVNGQRVVKNEQEIETKLLDIEGIDPTKVWSPHFIWKVRYDDPSFISHQELYWQLTHPEESQRMQQEHYHRIAHKEKTFIGNVRSRFAKVKALRDIGIEKFINAEVPQWQDDTPELVELCEKCRDEKVAIAIGIRQGKQKNTAFFSRILGIIGLKQKSERVGGKKSDQRERIYHLSDEIYDPYRMVALKCLDTRWKEYTEKQVEILNWEPLLGSQQTKLTENTTCQQTSVIDREENSPQTLTQQGFDTASTPPPENGNLYILQGGLDAKSQSESIESLESLENLLSIYAYPPEEKAKDEDGSLVTEGLEKAKDEEVSLVIGGLYRVRELSCNFGTVATQSSINWISGCQLDELPSQFRDYYTFSMPDGSRRAVHDEDAFEPETEESVAPSLGQKVAEAIKVGVEAVRSFLRGLEGELRYRALESFGELSPDGLEKLTAIAPDCWDICWETLS